MTKRLTLDNTKEISRQWGGECLSRIYINSLSYLEWHCTKDHK